MKAYTDALATINADETPQSQPVPGKGMVENAAGGYVFKLDKWAHLRRALILGSSNGTYYVSETRLTLEQSGTILECLSEDGERVVREIVEVSTKGLAPKQSPQIWALALALSKGNVATKHAAVDAVPVVCRTGSTFFELLSYVLGSVKKGEKRRSKGLRGMGTFLRLAIQAWYAQFDPPANEPLAELLMDVDKLSNTQIAAGKFAYQALKYRERNSWNHKDAMSVGHPKLTGPANDVARWVVKGWDGVGPEPHPEAHLRQIWAFERAKLVSLTTTGAWTGLTMSEPIEPIEVPAELVKTLREGEIVKLIRDHGLTREMIPTEFLKSPAIWEALLDKMPITAMVRNLANMTRCGLLAPHADATKLVVSRLGDVERLRKGRVHPMNLLVGLRAYAGPGRRARRSIFYGDDATKLDYSPVQDVVDALNDAFYESFGVVMPSGKRHMVCVDVSGSMSSLAPSMTNITCAEVAAAMALVIKRTEPDSSVWRFNTGLDTFAISPRMRLDDVLKHTQDVNAGGTDCALPMAYALEKGIKVDTFVVITDNETWAGRSHPFQALKKYREKMNIPAKLVVLAITGSASTIADPSDAGMLDISGFDLSVPGVLTNFSAGGSAPIEQEEE